MVAPLLPVCKFHGGGFTPSRWLSPGSEEAASQRADTTVTTQQNPPKSPQSSPNSRRFRSKTDPIPHPALDVPIPRDAASKQFGVDWVVFGVAGGVALVFLAWGFINTASLAAASTSALNWVLTNTGWLFVLTATGFVVYVIWLAVGRFGRIPLGRDDEEPEFRTVSWIAMMFSAGMGIGLMFYGVSEPISHLVTPPPGTGEPGNPEAVQNAMATTLFHWTLHPWAIYAVVGLAIAYGVYRKGRKQLISATFTSLLGNHVNGPAGKAIDIFAIFATLFGSATSLGLGALQINAGLEIVSGIGSLGNTVLIGIIAILTAAFVLSAVSGVARGIQWLSNINMVLALVLALFLFVIGPTIFILNLVPTSIGSYFQDLAMMAARTGAEGQATSDWLGSWTVFYWAWWLSWTPFVGMFIARISRGRTIRQFVAGVLLVPSVVSLIWFCILGGAAIDLQQLFSSSNGASGADIAGAGGQEAQLFSTLANYPLTAVTTVLVMILVAIFFVSGADAASIVMGSLSQRGTIEPTRPTVIFWGVATGAAAAVMLLVGGEDALTGLQQITTIAALPFVLIMIGIAVALTKDLQNDPMMIRRDYAVEAVNQAVVTGVTKYQDDFALAVTVSPNSDSESGPQEDQPDGAEAGDRQHS
jgi:choline/carnitine/betaine transport